MKNIEDGEKKTGVEEKIMIEIVITTSLPFVDLTTPERNTIIQYPITGHL